MLIVRRLPGRFVGIAVGCGVVESATVGCCYRSRNCCCHRKSRRRDRKSRRRIRRLDNPPKKRADQTLNRERPTSFRSDRRTCNRRRQQRHRKQLDLWVRRSAVAETDPSNRQQKAKDDRPSSRNLQQRCYRRQQTELSRLKCCLRSPRTG